MKACLQIIVIAFAATCAVHPFLQPAQSQARALVFSKTNGFRHDSIPDGVSTIRQLGQQNNFDVDATEDATLFTDSNLSRYQTVIFLNTTGDALDNEQQAAFERYIRNGGGFVGVHSATDTEYDWAWYGGLVGAYFQGHPAIQSARIMIEDGSHPSTSALPVEWRRTDEWYNFRSNPRGRVKVLAKLDETTYSGGSMGADHPIAWCQLYAGGRAWYTAGGHTRESYAEPLFRQHLLGGIQFTAKIKDGPCAVLAAASAASFRTSGVARESIASIFGSALSNETQAAEAIPLPTTLANTSVRVRDGAGNEIPAPLFFVSPTQVNFLIPSGSANGASIFTVLKSDGTAPSGVTQIAPVAPGIFSANANGGGVAAGVALRVKSNGSSVFEPIAQFDSTLNRLVSVPIDLGPPTDEVYLVLFGTGFRFRSAPATLKIGEVDAPVLFAGAQGDFAGLDQVNARLPRNLAGRGELDMELVVDGVAANTTRVNIK
ncbi:MAG TPA: ThuA domain-containing protein [Blastocatellia bacterium]|nr:ThuA domain-containing protein [Blastocatellia bacterium]